MENQSGTFIPNPNDFAMPKWLVKCELSMGAKLVYLILTICAGRQDFAFPSQEFLSRATSVCVRTLQRYLKALSDFGLIRIDKRKVHGTMRTVYCFLNHAVMDFEKKRPAASVEEPNPATAGPGGGVLENLSYEGDKSVRERGDNFSTASYKEEKAMERIITPPYPPPPHRHPSNRRRLLRRPQGGRIVFPELKRRATPKRKIRFGTRSRTN